MKCAEVREQLGAYATREGAAPLGVRRHLGSCADCRLELARYKAVVGSLAEMRTRPLEPPAGLLSLLTEIPNEIGRAGSVRVHVSRNKKAYIGGLAAVAVAGAGAALWRNRRAA